MERKELLQLIRNNIKQNGYHITFVRDGQNPNFSYTIGLKEVFGFELIIAGGYVSVELYENLFKSVVKSLSSGFSPKNDDFKSNFEGWKNIGLRLVDDSWCKLITLGVYDFYNMGTISAYQLYPKNFDFIDIPDMSMKWNELHPVWCWLGLEWNKKIPISSYAITNIDFLKGGTITEVMRWKEGYWEMFVGSGSDVLDKDVRILPISTFIGVDQTLDVVFNLKQNEGIWRDPIDLEWNEWN